MCVCVYAHIYSLLYIYILLLLYLYNFSIKHSFLRETNLKFMLCINPFVKECLRLLLCYCDKTLIKTSLAGLAASQVISPLSREVPRQELSRGHEEHSPLTRSRSLLGLLSCVKPGSRVGGAAHSELAVPEQFLKNVLQIEAVPHLNSFFPNHSSFCQEKTSIVDPLVTSHKHLSNCNLFFFVHPQDPMLISQYKI